MEDEYLARVTEILALDQGSKQLKIKLENCA
jgi:hypothetical protein